MVIMGPLRHERAVLKDAQGKLAEFEGRQVWVEWPDKVLVKPLSLLNLETYSLNGFEFFPWEVYNEPNAEVIQPC